MKNRCRKIFSNSVAQALSMDVMLAVIIFIGTFFFFYAIFSATQGSKADELHDEASKVLTGISSEDSGVRITDGNQINATRLGELLREQYPDIKSKLRVKNDFCIYFEDENGDIIYINPGSTGIGSDKIMVSNIPCG